MKDTVEHFSKQWYLYPWPAAINVAGFSTGMEYPGIVFDGIPDHGSFLFWVTAHEIGHDWFPMLVGSNERRHAFMDEGFNTFIDIDESATYAGAKYGPKPIQNTRPEASRRTRSSRCLTIPTRQHSWPQRIPMASRSVIPSATSKAPMEWSCCVNRFSAPSGSTGHSASTSETGPTSIHLRLTSSAKCRARAGKTSAGQLVLPTTIEVTFQDGTKARAKLPVETWLQKGTYTWMLENKTPITSVVVDPDHQLPDDDRSNNEKKTQ